jgi:hypothetical protein
MKNKSVLLVSFTILLVSVLGCSFYNPLESSSSNSADSNKTLSDRAIDSTVGNEKIGIPECDEILDFFAKQSESPDEDFVTKAARQYALNKIRESFKQTIEENKGDPVKTAKECREVKTQLDKFKAEEGNKQNN